MGPSIDSNKCIKCGGCVEICPGRNYEQKGPKAVPDVVNAPRCIACGHCLMRCPTDAISVPGYSPDKIHELGRLPVADEVASLFRGRRSVRSFSDQKVDRGLLEKVVSLAATAPSAENVQSTEFVVIQNPETIKLVEQYTTEALQRISKAMHNAFMRPMLRIMLGKRFKVAVESLPVVDFAIKEQIAGKHMILHEAPAIIAFHGQPEKSMASINAQLCIENALLAMTSMGLAGYYVGFVTVAAPRDKRLLEVLKVPRDHELFGVLTVGYPKVKLTRWVERSEPRITWV
jgi:nitroreductase/NAD-dependent dihydropyrimidine dehydrogenase PreA subunit